MRITELLTLLRFPLFTTGLMLEGPPQPVSCSGSDLAFCASGALFPAHPGAASSPFATLGPRVRAVRAAVVKTKLMALFGVSDEGHGARSWSLILRKCLMHHLVKSCSPN